MSFPTENWSHKLQEERQRKEEVTGQTHTWGSCDFHILLERVLRGGNKNCALGTKSIDVLWSGTRHNGIVERTH